MKRILFFILLIASFTADAQVKQQMGTYGIRSRRIQPDSAFRIPTVQVGIKDAYAGFDTAQIYYRKSDSSLLTYTGSQWILARGAAVAGSSYTAGDGLLLTGSEFKVLTKRSITIDNDSLMLVNDSTVRPPLYSYRVNAAGRPGWYPDNTIIGATPTWQQTLTAGSTLTGNNTIAGGGHNWTWNNSGTHTINLATGKTFDITSADNNMYANIRPTLLEYYSDANSGTNSVLVEANITSNRIQLYQTFANGGNTIQLDSATGFQAINTYNVRSSQIKMSKDTVWINPVLGNLHIDTLDAGVSTDSVLVRNASNGKVGYRNASAFGGTYTFTNGLTESGGTVKLGGTLVDASTDIDADGKDFNIANAGDVGIDGEAVILTGGAFGSGNAITLVDSISIFPFRSKLYIDSLAYTLSTTGKKIMLRDTASGLVQNIDPLLIGAPAGNYGNVQLNRNGALATPASDSVDYENSTGLTVKNNVTVEGTGKYFYGRWRARVDSTTSSATPTINTDNVDVYKLTAQAADITSMTTNLSGTPQDGDILELVITGTAARAITWGASFVSTTVTLPTTTVTTATLTVILQYYKSSSYGNNKWHCVNSY